MLYQYEQTQIGIRYLLITYKWLRRGLVVVSPPVLIQGFHLNYIIDSRQLSRGCRNDHTRMF